jgi:hypothetical protein
MYNNTPVASDTLQELWGEFLSAAIYIRNRVVTAINTITPFEKVFKKKPAVGHLRILGCAAAALIPTELRKKLDPTAIPGWFVGYPQNVKGWRIWDPRQRKIIISRDVTFNEEKFIGDVSADTKVMHKACEPFNILLDLITFYQPNASQQQQTTPAGIICA